MGAPGDTGPAGFVIFDPDHLKPPILAHEPVDVDGKRQSESHPTYREAEAAMRRRKVQAEGIRSGAVERPPDPHRFDELCDYWIEHQASRKRSSKDDESIIRRHLRPAFGGLLLGEVTVRRVDRFVTSKSELSPKTVHNHLTLLKSMLNLAVELGWLVKVPKIQKPRLVEQDYGWLKTEADIRALLGAATEEAPGVLEIYATAVYTGMRAGELLGLTWGEIDLERRLITVLRSYDKPTKTAAIRRVPILDPLLPVLRRWALECPTEVVFPGATGEPQGPGARVLQEVLKRCLERAELIGEEGHYERVTFHHLRHTFASHWVMAGGDMYRLQKILGHKSVQMTQRYAHLAPEVFSEDWGGWGMWCRGGVGWWRLGVGVEAKHVVLPRPLAQAVAWKTLAKLVWRHPGQDLRLVELHPGGGQYDELALVEGRFERVLVAFNLGGSSLRIECGGPEPGRLNYSVRFLEGADLVASVERSLGWGPARPTDSPSSVALAVLGEFLWRCAQADPPPAMACGWRDSSGLVGAGVASWADGLVADHESGRWQDTAARAARYWRVGTGPLVVDLRTSEVIGGDDAGWRCWEEYRRGAGIRALAWRLESQWRRQLGKDGG